MDVISALLIAALTTQATVEAVTHSEILRGLRLIADQAEATPSPAWRILLTPVRAINCPYCFSHWAGLLACLMLWIAYPGIGLGLSLLLWLPAVRLANTFNDLLGRRSRTPGRSENPRLDEAGPEELEERLTQLVGPLDRQ